MSINTTAGDNPKKRLFGYNQPMTGIDKLKCQLIKIAEVERVTSVCLAALLFIIVGDVVTLF